jgi:hypothetical protein
MNLKKNDGPFFLNRENDKTANWIGYARSVVWLIESSPLQ